MENRDFFELYNYTLNKQDYFSHVGFDPSGLYSIGGFPNDLNEGSLILKAEEFSGNYASPFYYSDAYFWEDAEHILLSEIGTRDYDLQFFRIYSTDTDGDGDVDGSDLAVFAADFGRTDCPLCEGDFVGDGDVDDSDLAVFAADFGNTYGP